MAFDWTLDSDKLHFSELSIKFYIKNENQLQLDQFL
jgi:hypothetical protein